MTAHIEDASPAGDPANGLGDPQITQDAVGVLHSATDDERPQSPNVSSTGGADEENTVVVAASTDAGDGRSSRTGSASSLNGPDGAAATGFGRRGVGQLVGVLLVLQCIFFALLVLAQLVPDDPIVDHLVEAGADRTYGPIGRPDNMGGISTSFDECVLVGTGLGRPDLDALERAARMPRIGSCSTGRGDLAALQRGDTPENVTEYFRYWAGWTVVSRPVLALWGIEALRRISGALLIVSGACLVVALARRTSATYVLALVLPVLLASNVLAMPSTSLNQSLSLAAALVSPTLTVIGGDRGRRVALIATAVGAAVYCYVDLMLVAAVPWMLSAAGAAAACFVSSGRRGVALRRGIEVAAVWPLAFAFTWLSRWVFATLFLGWEHATSVIRSKIEFRLGGSSTSVEPGLGRSTAVNFEYWSTSVSTAWAVLLLGVAVVVGALVVASRRGGPARLAVFAVLAWPAGLPLLWYEVVRNHSQIHPGKAHVSIAFAVGVGVAAAVLTASRAALVVSTAPDNARSESEHV